LCIYDSVHLSELREASCTHLGSESERASPLRNEHNLRGSEEAEEGERGDFGGRETIYFAPRKLGPLGLFAEPYKR